MEPCGYHPSPQSHIFGDGDAQNLLAAERRIVLLSAVAARDENVLASIGMDEAVKTESIVALHQDNVSSAQVGLGSGLHINHLSVANGGGHAGSARLKADAEPGLQAGQTESLELPGLRTVFFGGIFFYEIVVWASVIYAIGICAISHGS